MTELNPSICSCCNYQTAESCDFCPNCGNLPETGTHCITHPQIQADGVCIICCEPFCAECGSRVFGLFLCTKHAGYEIYENMARVFGTSDENLAQYAQTCLEQDGLHPFLFSRKASPIAFSGRDYALFGASGEFDGHLINEVKIMVPCQEVPEAEKLLRELELLK